MRKFYAGCVIGFTVGWLLPRAVFLFAFLIILALVAWGLILLASSRS